MVMIGDVDVGRQENARSFLARAREVADDAVSQPDPDNCLRKLRAGLIRLGFSRAGIWMADPNQSSYFHGTWGTDWDGSELDEHDLTHQIGTFLASSRIIMGERVVLDQTGRPIEPATPAHLPLHLTDGAPNNACVALRTDDQLLGIISVDMLLSGDVLERRHVAALELIADVVGVHLARNNPADRPGIGDDQVRAAIEALRESETRYRAVSEPASDFTWSAQILPDGSIENEWVTDSVERITGYTLDEAAGLLLPRSLAHADELPGVERDTANVLAGQTTTIEFRIVTKRGETKWLRLRRWPVWDGLHRRIMRMYAAAQDITDHRRAVAALEKSESSFRLLFQSNPHPMWVYDLETLDFLAVNDAAIMHYGYTRDEFLQLTISEIRPPQDVARLLVSVKDVRENFRHSGLWRHRRKDGSPIDVEVSSHPIEFDGRKAAVVAAFDVTERRRVEKAQSLLAEASRQFAGALDEEIVLTSLAHLVVPALADWCVVELVSSDGSIEPLVIAHSDDAQVALGWERARDYPVDPRGQRAIAQVVRTGQSILVEDVTDALVVEHALDAADLKRLRDTGMTSVMIVPITARGHVLGAISFVASESGRHFGPPDLILAEDLVGRAALAVDNVRLFAAERVAHQEAEVARGEIEALYEATKQITASLDLATTLGNILDAVVKLSGSSTAGVALLDATGTFLTIEAARGQFAEVIQGMTLSPHGVTGTVAATGKVFVSSDLQQDPRWSPAPGMHAEAIRSGVFVPLKANGRVIGVLSAWSDEVGHFSISHQRLLRGFSEQASLAVQRARDVEHRIQLEEQLRQSQKMEAIGQLAGGVAHDFNNLLTVINGYGEMLLEKIAPDAPEYEEVQQIIQAGASAAGLTRQLLAFSRRQVITLRETDLNLVVDTLSKMLRRLIGEDIVFATVLAPSLGLAQVDTGQIEQVLMNLAANARDAMPTGGKLTIETGNVELGAAYVREHPEAQAGLHVMIAVSDTGTGMDASTSAHIFEPFFTTKEVGRGTGLGLAAVYGIVKQCGGTIYVYSELGHGTTFKVYLPRVDAVAIAVQVPVTRQKMPRGTETILLVEDENNVRALARTALRACGYTVIEAEGGERAIQIVAEHNGEIDLLLTDVVMPRIGGRVVVEHVVARHPSVKVLYVSGYTDDVVIRHGVIEAGVDFLQKPYTPMILSQRVRQVLDRS